MSVLAVHTSVIRDGLPVHFAPGDEVPEWAEGKIGAHCLVSESEPDETTTADVPQGTEEKVDAEPASAPDFTKPAPAKRKPGRPRKTQG